MRIGVCGVFEQLVDCHVLDDLAGIHHHNIVRGLGDHSKIVRDQHHRHAQIVLQIKEQVEDLSLNGHIERRGRLVGNHQFGFAGDRHRNHRALPHTTGELVWVLMNARFRARDPDLFEHVRRAVECSRAIEAAVHHEHFSDLVAERVDRVQ